MRQGPQETLHFHPWNELPAESKLSEISSSELRSVQKGVRVTTETPARVAPFSKRIQSSSGTNLNSKWSITAGIFHVCLSYRTTLLPLKKILLGHRGGSFAFGSGHDPPIWGRSPAWALCSKERPRLPLCLTLLMLLSLILSLK